MTALRRFLLGLLAVIVLICGTGWWLLSTESGTRFLFARASGFLPEALTIAEVSGTLRSRISAGGIRWQDDSVDAQVDRLEVGLDLWQLLDEEIVLTDLRVDRVGVKVTPVAKDGDTGAPLDVRLPIRLVLRQSVVTSIELDINGAKRRIDQVEVVADMVGADLNIRALALDSQWLKLEAGGRIRLSGRLPLTASIDWEYLDVPEWPLAGELDIGGDLDALAVEHVLRLPVQVRSTGDVSIGDDGVFAELENRWENLELEALGIESRRGLLDFSGTAESFDVSVSALAAVAGIPETTINAEARMTPTDAQSLFVEASNAWGRTDVRGTASWGESIRFDLDIGVDEVDVQTLAPDLSGTLAANGRMRGEIDGTDRTIELEVDAIGGTLNGYPVSGSATVGIANDQLRVQQLLATVGTNRMTARGTVGNTIDIIASLNADTLAALHPDLQGEAEATFALKGATDNPTIDLGLTTKDIVWKERVIDQFTATVVGAADQHVIDISASVLSTTLSAALGGSLLEAGWRGDISRMQISHARAGQWSLEKPASLVVENASVALRDFCLLRADGEGSLCAAVSGGESTEFDLTIERLPVGLLPLNLPASIQPQGEIYASLEGTLVASLLNASAALEVRDAEVTSNFEDETLVTRFSTMRIDAEIADNGLTGTARIETQQGSLDVEARVGNIFDKASPVNGIATLDIPDLAQLSGLLPALANPVGVAEGELNVSGTVETPEITGSVQLRDGAFGVRAAGIRVENIEASVSQAEPGALALNASATSGDGQVTLLGETSIVDATRITTTLSLSGNRFELVKLPDLQALASPSVTVVVNDAMTSVSGKLDIPQASVTLRDIPASAAKVSPDTVVHRSGDQEELAAQRPINIDVETRLGDEVSLSAFGLDTNLEGNLQLRGDANKVINGFGRVSLTEGRYKAYGQDLAIQRGELIFNGPLSRPQLDIRAVRNAGDVIAGIQVRGRPDALQSEVFSEPPLRDIEALSYLLTGKPLSDGNSDGDLLGGAAFALGLSGAGAIASRVRSSLGLDTLSVQGGSTDGRIVAGKRLNDRLLVEYGYGIVDRLGTLLLRYQLNERLVLESRTGLNSNLDLVYRVKKP